MTAHALSKTKRRRRDARNRRARWILLGTCLFTIALALSLVTVLREPWYTLVLIVPAMLTAAARIPGWTLLDGKDLDPHWIRGWLALGLISGAATVVIMMAVIALTA